MKAGNEGNNEGIGQTPYGGEGSKLVVVPKVPNELEQMDG